MASINHTLTNGFPNGNHENGAPSKGSTRGAIGEKSEREDTNGIPPAEAYTHPRHVESITIPLNNVPAFTPTKKLRVVTIGGGFAGMTLAQKLQHKYAEEMGQIVDHTIYESKDQVGGTWIANTYPGVMCDVPAMIYVGLGLKENKYDRLTLTGFSVFSESQLEPILCHGLGNLEIHAKDC